MSDPESEVTKLLRAASKNRNDATQRLLPAVYDQLKSMAANKLAGESKGHTLQATALVHEAYLKLLGSIEDSWESRSHFFGAAAEAMRRILVDHARTKSRIKRGGNERPVALGDLDPPEKNPERVLEIIELDAALTKLAAKDPNKAELVKLRFFAGLTMQQAADALEMSLRTAERNWTFARAWLQDEIGRSIDQ